MEKSCMALLGNVVTYGCRRQQDQFSKRPHAMELSNGMINGLLNILFDSENCIEIVILVQNWLMWSNLTDKWPSISKIEMTVKAPEKTK